MSKIPSPVSAYAAVSPDGYKYITGIGEHSVQFAPDVSGVIPITIIPTEQYEAMVAALEHIADPLTALRNEAEAGGHRLNGMAYQIAYDSHQLIKVAKDVLAALKEQDHG